MAMLEKQLFDDGVGRGGTGGDLDLAAAAAAANSKSTTAGPTSSRLRIPTDQDACGKCGTTVPAIAISKAAYLSATSTTSGQLSSGHAPGNNSSEDHRHSRQAGADTSSSLTSIEHRRSEPRMLGMRGGLDAAGGAAEPISGLAAFGSQRSISDATNSIALASKPGGGTRLSPIQSITSSRPTPEVCTCQQKEKDSRTRPSGGGGGGGGGSGDGGNGGGGSSQGDMGYPNTSGGGPPSQGPFRGEAGGIGGGAGGGTKGSGVMKLV